MRNGCTSTAIPQMLPRKGGALAPGQQADGEAVLAPLWAVIVCDSLRVRGKIKGRGWGERRIKRRRGKQVGSGQPRRPKARHGGVSRTEGSSWLILIRTITGLC